MKDFIIQLLILGICLNFGITNEALAQKPKIIVSTDIGGSDPDDFQSMVHLLVYADQFEILGLISSPPHDGRVEHIFEAIDAYEKDFPKLQRQSTAFPEPDYLRKISKQGAIEPQSSEIPESLSEGAAFMISQIRANPDYPVYVLVWGSITDVAEAVHHDPSIKKNLRVYSIGSWNTEQDPKARAFLFENHPDLWWIENNTTFRGMYMGGEQSGEYGNISFVEKNIKDHGSLGKLFWEQKKDIKMGDTPSVLYFLQGNPENPESASWGGSFVKTGHGPNYWTDNPDPSLVENNRPGAKTVNKWRKEFLDNWAKRMKYLIPEI